jgi:DNA-binding NtrC family response regulator
MADTILVAEDLDTSRQSLCELLRGEGFEVYEASDGDTALKVLQDTNIGLLLTDLKMPGRDGLDLLRHVREISPQTLVILMTAFASVETAIEAMHLGAQEYILKPLIFEDVLRKVQRLMENKSLAWEIQVLRREISRHATTTAPLGRSRVMQDISRLIEKVARTASTVLVTGESGVGKEVVARTIHAQSPRRDKVFLPVNCSAIPENLLESQLFGHVKGAFTGANSTQEGLFQRAREGTIFLDEIGEMPLSLQPKLLRVIEEKKVMPVGSSNPISVDVRIIASTNRDLNEEVAKKRFREDLYYRLNVVGIHVPPLRERREDIPFLVEHLIARHNQEMKKSYKGLDNAAMRIFMSLPWRGNVRELDNLLERAMILGDDEWVTPKNLPVSEPSMDGHMGDDKLDAALQAYEKIHIEKTLDKSGRDKKLAAERLGLSLSTLYRKLEKLGIEY